MENFWEVFVSSNYVSDMSFELATPKVTIMLPDTLWWLFSNAFEMIFVISLSLISENTHNSRIVLHPPVGYSDIVRCISHLCVDNGINKSVLNGKPINFRLYCAIKNKISLRLVKLQCNRFWLIQNYINNVIQKSITMPTGRDEWVHGLDKILIEIQNKHICELLEAFLRFNSWKDVKC